MLGSRWGRYLRQYLVHSQDLIAQDEQFRSVQTAVKLCTARRGIQQKYLDDLRTAPEVVAAGLCVVEAPMLTTEVTGPQAVLEFSQLLVSPECRRFESPGHVQWPARRTRNTPAELAAGTRVRLHSFETFLHLNGLEGIVKKPDRHRLAVRVVVEGKAKLLSVRSRNLRPVSE
mmetsp:Transcript_36902/g.82973  ORF Transcript_36902/g.82973 Transcript_36902/m.82973 type:complete len:173 (-) Transcript_36902:63-581(-)